MVSDFASGHGGLINLETVKTFVVLAFTALLVYGFITSLYSVLRPDLRHIPGPFWAKVTRLWTVNIVRDGNGPSEFLSLHEKYGKFVRIGPNHISVSDSSVIPTIYGINTPFIKVKFSH